MIIDIPDWIFFIWMLFTIVGIEWLLLDIFLDVPFKRKLWKNGFADSAKGHYTFTPKVKGDKQ